MRATWPQFAQVVLGGLMLACMILIGMQYLHVSDHLAALRPGTRSFQKTELTSQCLMRNCSVHQENIKNVCISEELRIFEGALVLNPLAMLFLHLTSKINKENQRNSFGLVDDKLLQTQSNETEAEFMKRIATRMAIRRWRTRELCKIFGKEHKPTLRIAWSKRHHLVYCYIPKTGNTNWKRVMLILNNYTDMAGLKEVSENQVHVKVQGDYSTITTSLPLEAANFTKLIIVRHPFARLVSAYKDKVYVKPDQNMLLRQCEVLSKQHVLIRILYFAVLQRHSTIHAAGCSNYLPILDEKQHTMLTFCLSDKQIMIQSDSSIPPTFEEFIDYLLDGFVDRLDGFGDVAERHWAPYDRFCTPCSVDYDVIGKLETIAEDSRYVLNLINAGQVKFPEGYDTGGGGGSAVEQDNYVNYFKDIETDKIERLYKLFQKDFLLFDYAMPFT